MTDREQTRRDAERGNRAIALSAEVAMRDLQLVSRNCLVLLAELEQAEDEVKRLSTGSEIPALRLMVENQRARIEEVEFGARAERGMREQAERDVRQLRDDLTVVHRARQQAERERDEARGQKEQAVRDWRKSERERDELRKALDARGPRMLL